MSTALCCRRSRPQLLRSDYDVHRLSNGPTCRVLTERRKISRRLTHTQYTSPSSTFMGGFLFFLLLLFHHFPFSCFFFWSIAIGPLQVGTAKKKFLTRQSHTHTCIIFGPGI